MDPITLLNLNSDVMIHVLTFCDSKTWEKTVKTCKDVKNKLDFAPDKIFELVFFKQWLYMPNFPKIVHNDIWLNKFGRFKSSIVLSRLEARPFEDHFSNNIDSFWKFQSHIRRIHLLIEGLFNNDFSICNMILSHYSSFYINLSDLNHVFCCLRSTLGSTAYPNDKFEYFKDIYSKIARFIKLGNIVTQKKSIYKPLQIHEPRSQYNTIRSPRSFDSYSKAYQRTLVITHPERYLKQASKTAFETKDTNQRLGLLYLNVSHVIELICPDYKLDKRIRKHEPCFACCHKCL